MYCQDNAVTHSAKSFFYSSIIGLLTLITFSVCANETRRNHLDMEFVYISPGEFQMGTRMDNAQMIEDEMLNPEPGVFDDESPKHLVKISKGFWLQRTEVTQSQWQQVMENNPGPQEYWQRDDWRELPVVSVSWFMAQRFIEELNKVDKDFHYRLPTEAEWEYAARAGSDDVRPYPVSLLSEYAWFIKSSGDKPQPVATRKPNAWGLYDTLGNAWEWVNDWYAPDTYQKSTSDRSSRTGRRPITGPARWLLSLSLVSNTPGLSRGKPSRHSLFGDWLQVGGRKKVN